MTIKISLLAIRLMVPLNIVFESPVSELLFGLDIRVFLVLFLLGQYLVAMIIMSSFWVMRHKMILTNICDYQSVSQ